MKQAILLLVLATLMGGCMTAVNMQEDKNVYGGVSNCLSTYEKIHQFSPVDPLGKPLLPAPAVWLYRLVLTGIITVDLPFTMVGDTATLPWTVTEESNRRSSH